MLESRSKTRTATPSRCSFCLLVGGLVACSTSAPTLLAEEQSPVPDVYVLDYPDAEQCSPPIRSTFAEVTRTLGNVRGKRFRQQPNGGYGLPVADKVNRKHLLHVGADLGWYQVGEPVFAIASGVVRISSGPDFRADKARPKDEPGNAASLLWGNFVAIEHRFALNQYVTSVYGHLGTDRRVKAGDIVGAGEQIGTIGRQHLRVNGGYKPHLHLGIRKGRIAEEGSPLLQLAVNGRRCEIVLVALDKEWSEVRVPPDVKLPLQVNYNGRRYDIERHAEKTVVSSTLLWQIQRPEFPLVGYSLSTEGWQDPVRFLRQHRADTAPAPYRVR